ncbi:MAG TPA: lysylphosphatidylglycerol synthase transmembrane domain-containing protein [Actinomycetota bacterium]|nr:lysylphosphatidylglycerol synthase transmembrane domain-containing protein [Actinomycetota bacterium]
MDEPRDELAIPEDRPGRSLTGRLIRGLVVAISIGILAHVLLLEGPGIARAGRALRHIHPVYIAGAVALEVASNASLVQLYRTTLQAAGSDISYARALPVSMGGFMVSRVFPGGAATAAVVMTRAFGAQGVASTVAAGSVVVAGTLGMLVLGGLVSLGALGSLARGDLPTAYVIAVPIIVALLIGACVLGVRFLREPHSVSKLVLRIDGALRRIRIRLPGSIAAFTHDFATQLPPLDRLKRPALWSAVNWGSDIAALWLLFYALGYHIHLGVVVVGYGLANLLTALPITPGGLGLVEAGLAGTYTAFGAPPEISVIAVLGYRLVSYWLPVMAGIPPYVRLMSKRRALEATATGGGR